MLRFLTAGESHGEKEIAILEGFPSGVAIDTTFINRQLAERQKGYGRGNRMNIEKDKANIISGLKNGKTIGSPIGIVIKNKDFSINELPEVRKVRPGHADLAGVLKYGFDDARCVLERASARETVARVAVGSICKQLLYNFNIEVLSHTVGVGNVNVKKDSVTIQDIKQISDKSVLRCLDKDVEKEMIKIIDKAKNDKDTLGGVIEIIVGEVPPGLGSYVQYDRKLDAKLAGALMSIPAIKAVEIGAGIKSAENFGSKVHDEIYFDDNKKISRKTNRAGGLEGGVSNGEDIVIRIYMKPISTLMKPLDTIDIKTGDKVKAVKERSDVCAVPAAGIVAESMCAFILAVAFLEKFGNDSLIDVKNSYKEYMNRVKDCCRKDT